jgi:hypothetical protein
MGMNGDYGIKRRANSDQRFVYINRDLLEGKRGVHGQRSGVARPDTAFTSHEEQIHHQFIEMSKEQSVLIYACEVYTEFEWDSSLD